MIVVVDYGLGNLGSIPNMLKKVGVESVVSGEPDVVKDATKLILPGVGAFDHGMTNLRERGLIEPLNQHVRERGTPVLGICLGMQLLGRGSEEGELPGLGWVDAHAVRFRAAAGAEKLTVPHMGWNYIEARNGSRLLEGLPDDPRFYFVHSYYMVPDDPVVSAGETMYSVRFTSVVERDNVLGAQFHPEKSHKFGMQLFRNFVDRF